MLNEILPSQKFTLCLDRETERCTTMTSVVSFRYDKHSIAHIYEDDHCYILAIWHQNKAGFEYYSPTHYIFPEALEVLKTLQDPWLR